jgi:hypothetical protein
VEIILNSELFFVMLQLQPQFATKLNGSDSEQFNFYVMDAENNCKKRTE